MPLLNPDEVYKAALQQWAAKAKAARRAEDKEKAFEQFKRLAEQAHVTPEMLVPEPAWPFPLTEDDKEFLRSLPYPISRA